MVYIICFISQVSRSDGACRYTLLLKGTQPSGRLDSEKKWVVSDEKQRTDFDFIAQLVFNCPPGTFAPPCLSPCHGATRR
jgi:hypothetical protein